MSKIQSAKNKIAVETELSDILKSIDPTELKNDELIETYTFFMEKTINDMKLIDSEKDRVMKKIAQKRKGAKYDAFSGLGQSAISVAISATGTGPMAPYALVGSILTSTINCGLNYARTINQLDGEKLDAQLKFDEDQEKAIDYARANLFTQTAKIFKHVEYNGKQIIDEADMSTFASQIAEIEAETDVEKRRELSNKYFKYFFEDKIVERKFKNFLPYWEAQIKISSYLYAHSKKQNDKQGMKKAYDFAFVCYNNLMRLSNGSFKNFYTKNPYLREASKVLLPMEIEQNRHADRINLLLSSIEENSDDMERLKEFPLLQFSAYYALGDMDRAEKAHKELIRNGEIKFFDPIDNLFVLSNKRSSDVDRHLAEMKQIYYAIVDNIGWWGEGGQSFGIKLNGSIFNGTSVRIYFKCVDKEQSMSFNKIASHFGSNTIEEQRKKC
ncbi:MAG: hypothetical protein HUK21_05080, partial [Fibrobacteraceae bacterium]|nr:hypothetical protein [Fibrobacteraceae bacterium]